MTRLRALVLVGLLAGCGLETPPPDTARMPGNTAFSLGDPDMWAINQAQWAFAVASRTHNNPADAARASAAVDYLAGQLNTSPRWAGLSPLAKMEMLQARQEVRATLGIVPNAPSQLVVDSLMAAADALTVGNPHAAMAALHNPAFTLPPERTLAILSAMPYLRTTNLATMRAATDVVSDGSWPSPWR